MTLTLTPTQAPSVTGDMSCTARRRLRCPCSCPTYWCVPWPPCRWARSSARQAISSPACSTRRCAHSYLEAVNGKDSQCVGLVNGVYDHRADMGNKAVIRSPHVPCNASPTTLMPRHVSEWRWRKVRMDGTQRLPECRMTACAKPATRETSGDVVGSKPTDPVQKTARVSG